MLKTVIFHNNNAEISKKMYQINSFLQSIGIILHIFTFLKFFFEFRKMNKVFRILNNMFLS